MSVPPSTTPAPPGREPNRAAGRLQPARVGLHAGFGALPVLYWLAGIPRLWMLGVASILAAAFLILDGARLVWPAWNRWTVSRFTGLLRGREARRLTGASYSVAALVVAVWAFTPAVVAAAFLYHSVGDPAAGWVGRRFGRRRIGGKSLEGTAAFVISGALAAWAVVGAGPAVAGALAAGGAELLVPLDDNLSVPLVGGAVSAWVAAAGL